MTTWLRAEFSLQPRRRRFRLHPFELRQLVPEPGELPFGIVPRIGAADLGGFLERDLTFEMPQQRWHAMRFHRRQQRIKLSSGEPRYFLQRA